MVLRLSEEKKNIVLRIYKYFESERKDEHPFHAIDKVAERTIHALEIDHHFIRHSKSRQNVEISERCFIEKRLARCTHSGC
jgi:predicted metallo-beta-lactamase superfamily hydrolase